MTLLKMKTAHSVADTLHVARCSIIDRYPICIEDGFNISNLPQHCGTSSLDFSFCWFDAFRPQIIC